MFADGPMFKVYLTFEIVNSIPCTVADSIKICNLYHSNFFIILVRL